MITVVGGVYQERCVSPKWEEIYGSAGRAATALARMQAKVELHTYADPTVATVISQRGALEGFQVVAIDVPESPAFSYVHGLSSPIIHKPHCHLPAIEIRAEKVVRFGMIEGDAKVEATYAVYDPQNAFRPLPFGANGSTAKHLALILNRHEAELFLGTHGKAPEELAFEVAKAEAAEIVVIKMGPMGALVYHNGEVSQVPAYHSERVHKIGSGDTFVAHFAYGWLDAGLSPRDAADAASRATAYYCENQGFVTPRRLSEFRLTPLHVSPRYHHGYRPKIYLAGPFFSLAQLWLIEEARNSFLAMGLQVFSPYHDVGHGSAEDVVKKDLDAIHDCELMFAVGDGLDSGTIFEIGYARALKKPVVMYVENESEEDKKMMEGSNCILSNDFVTAIYRMAWEAISL
ncbi:PfkB family carbohydrate kinase [Halomonas sp. NO4]|uniref:PfkB family carbohydrate kinase n=1 Tax=Halomonas sp. NO4 TaxID=2484813 RepID=UPI0013D7B891|nr:PfkB family carbohydrate kinase [Halomonas sp. NO4]